jgi:hypothetical protein
MLLRRREQGAPLEVLDLQTCIAAEHAIELLAEAVGNVRGTVTMPKPEDPEFCDWRGGIEFFDEDEEEEYDDISNYGTDSYDDEVDVDEYGIPFDVDEDDPYDDYLNL